MGAMHEAWCARDDARETALCVNWRGSAARRAEAAAKKEAHKATPNYGSEYVEMHTAYCDDKPENAETAPCVMHAMVRPPRRTARTRRTLAVPAAFVPSPPSPPSPPPSSGGAATSPMLACSHAA